MARIRTIKPEFPQSESMGRVSREARLTFVLLWTIADDEGRLRGNSRMLASLLFPYDEDAPGQIEGWLCELEEENCIVRYQVDGATYVQILNWLNHQKIDRPSSSKIPPFDESSRVIAKDREASSLDQGSRIKDQGPKDQGRAENSALSADFETWWSAYPRKASKGQARKAYIAARKRGIEADLLLAGAKRYAADPKRDPNFTKHGSTWLTGECWLDEQASEPKAKPADPEAELKDAAWKVRTCKTNLERVPAGTIAKLIERGMVTMEQAKAYGYTPPGEPMVKFNSGDILRRTA
jgi:hypothetical protein